MMVYYVVFLLDTLFIPGPSFFFYSVNLIFGMSSIRDMPHNNTKTPLTVAFYTMLLYTLPHICAKLLNVWAALWMNFALWINPFIFGVPHDIIDLSIMPETFVEVCLGA